MIKIKKSVANPFWNVYLDGKRVGKIICKNDVYRYYPKGDKTGGDPFMSLADCLYSLKD